ncbi:anaerobic glycerol-3-phosphate dehydrogenase subunit GlpA [Miltoncostaea marina]|uniref:anaerobic glycerol-3-phosphate dehydrogenase subunit GlpA n=1 Tax=Miltoncostaea marina TaxID=2843215 RepID=UPI0031BA1981
MGCDVLVIGGGATGLGVVRDAAMRGWSAVLVERVDLGQGTTGRFHGLLHSGGRYVVSDPRSATECAEENAILRRIAADAVEDTGGLFVTTPADDPAYADRFLAGCAEHGVAAEEVPVAEALRREPRLNPAISRAFEVADASIDSWTLLWGNARSAREHGARILPYHWVTGVLRDGDRVAGVTAQDNRGHREVRIEAGFTINAAGVWAGQLADMAGCPGVTVVPGKGIMIAMNHRLVGTVINRCELPGDGDILVPIHTVCVIGTTDVKAPTPDDLSIARDQVQEMLDAGEVLVPGFRESRALHAWSGSRPLFTDERADGAQDTRHMSRGLALVDHLERDGVEGFLTITGGKLTTYRLMAETVVDAMGEQLGDPRPCRTAAEPLPGSEDGRPYWLGSRLRRQEEVMPDDQLICECELMQRSRLEAAAASRPGLNLDDVRRVLRLGMGPCQGGFCTYRAAGVLHAIGDADGPRADELLLQFLHHRWLGIEPILAGRGMRQACIDDWIFQGALDVEHLPVTPPA